MTVILKGIKLISCLLMALGTGPAWGPRTALATTMMLHSWDSRSCMRRRLVLEVDTSFPDLQLHILLKTTDDITWRDALV